MRSNLAHLDGLEAPGLKLFVGMAGLSIVYTFSPGVSTGHEVMFSQVFSM